MSVAHSDARGGHAVTDRLELDYQQTSEMFRLLAGIRFKLLALVPAVAGVGTALVGETGMHAEVQLALGLLGFVATLGILLYELRNSELYNWAIHRAKHLERAMGLSSLVLGAPQGGVFGERVAPHHRVLGLALIKHDQALALVYGSALGAWTWVALRGLLTLVTDWSNRTVFWVALGGAVTMGCVFVWQVNRHDRRQRSPKAVADADHFNAALEELRFDLNRVAKMPAAKPEDKRTRRERKLDHLGARCTRIFNQRPPIGQERREALRCELIRLQGALTNVKHESMTEAEAQCRNLIDELGTDAGRGSSGTHGSR